MAKPLAILPVRRLNWVASGYSLANDHPFADVGAYKQVVENLTGCDGIGRTEPIAIACLRFVVRTSLLWLLVWRLP